MTLFAEGALGHDDVAWAHELDYADLAAEVQLANGRERKFLGLFAGNVGDEVIGVDLDLDAAAFLGEPGDVEASLLEAPEVELIPVVGDEPRTTSTQTSETRRSVTCLPLGDIAMKTITMSRRTLAMFDGLRRRLPIMAREASSRRV